jgi:hypothetical protein
MPDIDTSTKTLLERIRQAVERQRQTREAASKAGEEIQKQKEQPPQPQQ